MEDTTTPAISKPALPTFAKVIAAFYMLVGILGIIGATVILIFSLRYGAFSPFSKYGTTGTIGIFGFALIVLLVSRGLSRRHRWARVIAVALGSVSLLSAVYWYKNGFAQAAAQFVVNLIIVNYLVFNRRVRAAFKK